LYWFKYGAMLRGPGELIFQGMVLRGSEAAVCTGLAQSLLGAPGLDAGKEIYGLRLGQTETKGTHPYNPIVIFGFLGNVSGKIVALALAL
jgi:hypothetical protein